MAFNDTYFEVTKLESLLPGRSTIVTYDQYVDQCTAFGEEPLSMKQFVEKVKETTRLVNEPIVNVGKGSLFKAALSEWEALGYGGAKHKKHPRIPIWVDRDAVDDVKKPAKNIRRSVIELVEDMHAEGLIEDQPVSDIDKVMVEWMTERKISVLTKSERQAAIESVTGFTRKYNGRHVYSWLKRF